MKSPDPLPADDLGQALVEADALETFEALPAEERDRFRAWIAKARDDESHWRRIEILCLAMRMAPPLRAPDESRPERQDFWTNPMGRS